MKWVRYQDRAGINHGILKGELIHEIEGSPFGTHQRNGRSVTLRAVRLLPPVIPQTFYACGLNYTKHIGEAEGFLGKQTKRPTRPEINYRAVNALIGDSEGIIIPRDSAGRVQYEGELVVVIGRKAKHLTPSEALSCVFGYTIGNDVSERVWQKLDRILWRPKNTDTFKPMGPWIETDVNLDSLVTRGRLNGKQVSEFKTNRMIFGIADFIVEISKYLTLYPGDVIWMGADAPTLDMVPGDAVEVEISGIGTLRSPVVAEE